MAPRLDRLPSFEGTQIIYVHEEGVCDLELPASPMWVDLRGMCHTSLFDVIEEEKAPQAAEHTAKADREALLHHLGGQRMGGVFEKKSKVSREPMRCNQMPRRTYHHLQQPRAVY